MRKRDQSPTSFLGRLSYFLRPVPATTEQLFEMLGPACRRDLFDENALPMMQRIIQVSEFRVTQVMVARAQMVTIDSSKSFNEILLKVIDSAHSSVAGGPTIGSLAMHP
jgi:Mg2+/Co2+ transporter CorC